MSSKDKANPTGPDSPRAKKYEAKLIEMGYSKPLVVAALQESNYDFVAALDLLNKDAVVFGESKDGEDPEILLAEGDENDSEDEDTWPAAEPVLIDARLQSLLDMGFSKEVSQEALDSCNGDFNEALSKILAETS